MSMLLGFIMGLMALVPVNMVFAAETPLVKNDKDGNGPIERSIEYDADGQPLRLRADTNGDGRLDTIQHYHREKVVRMENDTDHDGNIDRVTHYERKRRTRVEFLDRGRRIVKIVQLDAQERPRLIQEDANGDGRMDVEYEYAAGVLDRMAADIDANGHPEKEIFYTNGQPARQEEDNDQDGRADVITHYRNGLAHKLEEDTNADGKVDRRTYYGAAGLPERMASDTRHSGRIDRIDRFEDGVVVETEEDIDGDGFRETRSAYASGRIVTRWQDRNRDYKPDTMTRYEAGGNPQSVETDEDLDGRMDKWEFYRKRVLERLERDVDGDGRIDFKVIYAHGKKLRSAQDANGNGYFEHVNTFDEDGETAIAKFDGDENRIYERHDHYQSQVIRKTLHDLDQDGTPDRIEYFGETGILERREEEPGRDGRMGMVWHFDAQGRPRQALKDADHDGRPDIWYFYADGRLDRVEEDTDQNGQADLWERYDESGRLQWRARDLDHDGAPDLEDRVTVSSDPKAAKIQSSQNPHGRKNKPSQDPDG